MARLNPSAGATEDAGTPTSRRTFLRIAGATAGVGLAAAPAAGESPTDRETTRIAVSPAQQSAVEGALDRLSASAREATSITHLETSAGFRAFASGDVDLHVGSRPILADEHARTRENDVEYETREVPTSVATIDPPSSSWVECLRPSNLAATWASDDPVETWAEVAPEESASISDGEPEVSESARDGSQRGPVDGPALVRGVRSHQYATGYGGVGYYEPALDWFDDVPAASNTDATMTAVVRLSFLYGDRRVLDRPTPADFLDAYAQRSAETVGDVAYFADPLGQ